MIEIKKLKDIKEKVNIYNINSEMFKDLVTTTMIMEYEFDESDINKIVILDEDEDFEEPPKDEEFQLVIGGYKKKVFIMCDTGESIITYKKLGVSRVLGVDDNA